MSFTIRNTLGMVLQLWCFFCSSHNLKDFWATIVLYTSVYNALCPWIKWTHTKKISWDIVNLFMQGKVTGSLQRDQGTLPTPPPWPLYILTLPDFPSQLQPALKAAGWLIGEVWVWTSILWSWETVLGPRNWMLGPSTVGEQVTCFRIPESNM